MSNSKAPGWVRVRAWFWRQSAQSEASAGMKQKEHLPVLVPLGGSRTGTAGVEELWRMQEPERGCRLFGFVKCEFPKPG